MKKQIIIVSHALEIGGAERALIGLLHAFDYTQVSVDLFLMRHAGELMPHIPPQVNLLPELPQYASLAVPMKTVLKKRQFGILLGRIGGKLAAKNYYNRHSLSGETGIGLEYSHKYTRRFMPKIGEKEYDLAVSFLTPHYFAAEKIRAKRKIAWIHTDYTKIAVDRDSEYSMWDRYDHIASISEAVTNSFLQIFPGLREKVISIENILPEKLIRQDAALPAPADMAQDGSIRLLSIGRYCTAKNFDNVPEICAGLLRRGVNARWYLIGFGPDEPLIRERIAQAHMEDRVILLGKKENPYPYIQACDLYVQPSRYEGKSVTVREAQMLGKPVVITKYATSSSQLEDGIDGVIVPMDNDGCAAGIASLLQDPERMQQLAQACSERDYSNAKEAEKLYPLMET